MRRVQDSLSTTLGTSRSDQTKAFQVTQQFVQGWTAHSCSRYVECRHERRLIVRVEIAPTLHHFLHTLLGTARFFRILVPNICIKNDQHGRGVLSVADSLLYRTLQLAWFNHLVPFHPEWSGDLDNSEPTQQYGNRADLRVTLDNGNNRHRQATFAKGRATGPNKLN